MPIMILPLGVLKNWLRVEEGGAQRQMRCPR